MSAGRDRALHRARAFLAKARDRSSTPAEKAGSESRLRRLRSAWAFTEDELEPERTEFVMVAEWWHVPLLDALLVMAGGTVRGELAWAARRAALRGRGAAAGDVARRFVALKGAVERAATAATQRPAGAPAPLYDRGFLLGWTDVVERAVRADWLCTAACALYGRAREEAERARAHAIRFETRDQGPSHDAPLTTAAPLLLEAGEPPPMPSAEESSGAPGPEDIPQRPRFMPRHSAIEWASRMEWPR